MSTPPKTARHHIVPALAQGTRTLYQTKTEHSAGANTYSWQRTVPCGTQTFTYEVHLDSKALTELAAKAASNKTKQARSGPISIKVVSTNDALFLGAVETNTEAK